jgi:hypothetical protein
MLCVECECFFFFFNILFQFLKRYCTVFSASIVVENLLVLKCYYLFIDSNIFLFSDE